MGKPAFRALSSAAAAFAISMGIAAESSAGELLERPLDPEETQEAPELWDRPRAAIGIDAGFGHYGNGLPARDWGFGVARQLRVGVQWSSIVATDIRWFGNENTRVEFDVLTTGLSVDVRLSVPLAVRPFFAVGLGWYSTLLSDHRGLTFAPPLAIQAPLSAGLEVPVWRALSAQLEFTHRFLSSGAIVDVYPATMQLWSVTAGARAYF